MVCDRGKYKAITNTTIKTKSPPRTQVTTTNPPIDQNHHNNYHRQTTIKIPQNTNTTTKPQPNYH
jgi:hypothetical protein